MDAGHSHGRVVRIAVPAPALGASIDVDVYRPHGSAPEGLPTVYLLHGRGDTHAAWTSLISELDSLIGRASLPPLLAVMPDAPWSRRAGYYVDSLHELGSPVETAITADLVPFIDATFGTGAAGPRLIAGYSMGGAGAIRLLGAHPGLFAGAIALSPAVYVPLPPEGSSTRLHGAFGVGSALFVDERYQSLAYPVVLGAAAGRKLFLGHGDDEYRSPDAAESLHDVDAEVAALAAFARSAGLTTAVGVYPGGHDWNTWLPGFVDGLRWCLGSV